MGQNVLQISSDDEDCVYIYNYNTGKWQKLCDIKSVEDIPESIKQKLQTAQRSTIGSR